MTDKKITQLNELAAFPEETDLCVVVDDPGGLAETKKITIANLLKSRFPVGGVIPIFTSMTGCPTPATADGWAACNGTTAASQGVVSPTITATLPNINAGAFIRAATSSWTTGGASGGADSVTITANNLPTHTHSIDHTHGAFTSGGQSVTHTHAISGTTASNTDGHVHTGTTGNQSGNTLLSTTGNYGNASGPIGLGNHTHTFTTDNESATHTHTYSSTSGNASADHSHSLTVSAYSGNSGNNSTTATALATLPVYFSAVFYMRTK